MFQKGSLFDWANNTPMPKSAQGIRLLEQEITDGKFEGQWPSLLGLRFYQHAVLGLRSFDTASSRLSDKSETAVCWLEQAALIAEPREQVRVHQLDHESFGVSNIDARPSNSRHGRLFLPFVYYLAVSLREKTPFPR